MEIQLEGIGELSAALDLLRDRAALAAGEAADAMARVAHVAIREKLNLAGHAPGTPTPSPPGSPPARITGRLDESVRVTQRHREPGRAEDHVAPTAVYARIQELGGWTGAGHQTYLPPRPYVRPAVEAARPRLRRAAEDVFRVAVEG